MDHGIFRSCLSRVLLWEIQAANRDNLLPCHGVDWCFQNFYLDDGLGFVREGHTSMVSLIAVGARRNSTLVWPSLLLAVDFFTQPASHFSFAVRSCLARISLRRPAIINDVSMLIVAGRRCCEVPDHTIWHIFVLLASFSQFLAVYVSELRGTAADHSFLFDLWCW